MIDSVIEDFKTIYKNCEGHFEGFKPRYEQRKMSFEIATSLCDDRGVVVCEAGTGVGKSFGYMMPAITIAKKQDKKVIISTATIALQEQVLNKDLPLFQKVSPTEFTYALAKGRSNYACTEKIHQELEAVEQVGGMDMVSNDHELHQLNVMLSKLKNNTWNGERSTWPSKVSDKLWDSIKSDNHSCKKSNKAHADCAFIKAREELLHCDVIVANHSLVLADLAIAEGGGAILPEADNCIYVFDEGHHLRKIALDSVSGQFGIGGTLDFNDSVRKSMIRWHKKTTTEEALKPIIPDLDRADSLTHDLDNVLKSLDMHFRSNPALFDNSTYIMRELHQAELDWYNEIHTLVGSLRKALTKQSSLVEKLLEDEKVNDTKEMEQVVSDLSFYVGRYDNITAVLDLLLGKTTEKVVAKWASQTERGFHVNASPTDASHTMQRLIWDHADKVVITSATLSALGNFELYKSEVGLPEDAKAFSLGSPFDYPNVSELYLPPVKINPQQQDVFTDYLSTDMFDTYIKGQTATLVLFSSYWQMNKVKDKIAPIVEKAGYKIQCQGDTSKERMLKNHREYIAKGIPSILMGTGSFSEGLDLPRDLLENVVITKLPFGTPNDPVSLIHSEHVQKNGGKPFFDITLPEASRQLIQAVGRLIRTVDDSGRVIILDNRMTTKGYGRQLLGCLPPFKVIKGYPAN